MTFYSLSTFDNPLFIAAMSWECRYLILLKFLLFTFMRFLSQMIEQYHINKTHKKIKSRNQVVLDIVTSIPKKDLFKEITTPNDFWQQRQKGL